MHNAIRKLRKERSLTQQQVANYLNLDRSTYAYNFFASAPPGPADHPPRERRGLFCFPRRLKSNSKPGLLYFLRGLFAALVLQVLQSIPQRNIHKPIH